MRYSDLEQEELDTPAGTSLDEVASSVQNRSLIFRGELKRDAGRIHTRSGVWGRLRNVQAAGTDTLEPEVEARALAVFSYNEIHAGERVSLSFAGRLERNVDIKLAGTAGYAPSIPPFGGRMRLHVPVGRFQLNPELRWAARMDRLNPGETPTDGYALLSLNASWVFAGRHTTSTLSFQAFNLTDAEHRRHSALGKDLYLLMGRSFRIGYSLRFF